MEWNNNKYGVFFYYVWNKLVCHLHFIEVMSIPPKYENECLKGNRIEWKFSLTIQFLLTKLPNQGLDGLSFKDPFHSLCPSQANGQWYYISPMGYKLIVIYLYGTHITCLNTHITTCIKIVTYTVLYTLMYWKFLLNSNMVSKLPILTEFSNQEIWCYIFNLKWSSKN